MNQQLAQIVLLTGYLGSGKTTLIKYILESQNQYKIAVIQNEFADEMGIESPLMQDSEGKAFDKFYELPNGCICCSAKGDMLIAVEYFIKSEKQLDFILVETNGLADPSSTIQQFWVDQELKFPAELRSVNALVPTHRFRELWDQKDEIFQKQLVYADTIILNYMDQAKPIDIVYCRDIIQQINPTATFVESSFCIFSLELIFKNQPYKPQLLNIHEVPNLHTSSSIEHLYLKFHQEHDKHQWERNIGMILWEGSFRVMRMKGLVQVKGDSRVHSIQAVNDTFEVQETNTKWESVDENINKFLIIGYGLNREMIQNMLCTFQ